MVKKRICVQVVGFSDVERHALNTLFRLSEDNDLTYSPCESPVGDGTDAAAPRAEVLLVDGQCAEAVLYHAKALPTGQRLIWVGTPPPLHAWRTLTRPIQWAALVQELDTVHAAHQADSGLLDLDVSRPGELESGAATAFRRALLVGHGDLLAFAQALSKAGVPEVDHASSTEMAQMLLTRQSYRLGLFDLDEHHIDTWHLAGQFSQHNPQAQTLGITAFAATGSPWLRRRRVHRDAERAGIRTLVSRSVDSDEFRHWLGALPA